MELVGPRRSRVHIAQKVAYFESSWRKLGIKQMTIRNWSHIPGDKSPIFVKNSDGARTQGGHFCKKMALFENIYFRNLHTSIFQWIFFVVYSIKINIFYYLLKIIKYIELNVTACYKTAIISKLVKI